MKTHRILLSGFGVVTALLLAQNVQGAEPLTVQPLVHTTAKTAARTTTADSKQVPVQEVQWRRGWGGGWRGGWGGGWRGRGGWGWGGRRWGVGVGYWGGGWRRPYYWGSYYRPRYYGAYWGGYPRYYGGYGYGGYGYGYPAYTTYVTPGYYGTPYGYCY